ncbi:MAG TPA: twin-arginine translocase TatA/TatE family subunit [Candidatus Limnocylindrales bacterium]|nr:twin-arginine translocase TatA/TatE family subunit [Candidatus Limnocylindrales bacterium]
MPFNIGPGELILILIIALVVLGPGKLPDVANSLGKSVREFRKAATDISDAGKLDVPPPSQQATPPAPPLGSEAEAPAPTAKPDADAPTAAGSTAAGSAAAGAPARDPNLS